MFPAVLISTSSLHAKMSAYSVQDESRSILRDLLLKDPKLNLPASYAAAAEKVRFEGPDSQPFIPTPLKITESSSALNGLLATAASAVAHDRYGTPLQDVVVNTDLSTLFLMSLLLPTVSPSGVPALEHPVIKRGLAAGELHDMTRPLRRLCTNVYRTRDGRFFHLHGSMSSSPSMKMVGLAPGSVEEQAVRDVDMQGAIDVYSAKVAEWDADEIDRTANDEYGQAGTVCLTPEEFAASEHGRAMESEGLYVLNEVKAERKPWPAPAPASAAAGAGEGEDEEKETTTKNPGRRPLEGIRVIDFSRVIAGPVISKMLAVLGADVVKVTARHLPDVSVTWVDLSAGKKDASLDLKASPEDRRAFEDVVRGADVLIDGYRPGVLEGKLGYDRKKLRELNPQLVYLHENCYGWKGPLAKRSGWQQISDCVTGISWMQGRFLGLDEPVVPLLREWTAFLFSSLFTVTKKV